MNNEPLSRLGAWRTHDHARVEHLAVCKQGAIVRLEAGDLQGAIASMISDLRKADEPLYDAALLRALLADALCFRNTPDQVRDWIDGFN
jgi:hypothetical protein